MGLNNIKANDYMNIILHALAHVLPFTSYFLSEDNYKHIVPPPGDQTFILGALCFYFFVSAVLHLFPPSSAIGRAFSQVMES